MPQTVVLIDKDGNVVDSLKVELALAKGKIPTDLQARLQKYEQGHASQPIPPTTGNTVASANWIDTDGFDKIVISLNNVSGGSTYVDLLWSHDGVNTVGKTSASDVIPTGTGTQRSSKGIETVARWVKPQVTNNDATPQTVSTYVYKKA